MSDHPITLSFIISYALLPPATRVLGLPLVLGQLVKLMPRRIGVEALSGKGTTCWFSMPFGTQPAARGLATATPAPGSADKVVSEDKDLPFLERSRGLERLGKPTRSQPNINT